MRNVFLERIAAQAILATIGPRNGSTIRERTHQFLADKGAVGPVLADYCESRDLSATSLRYWDSKLEPSSLRLEDLFTAILIAVGSSTAAALLIEGGKSLFPKIFRALRAQHHRVNIMQLADLERDRNQHLGALVSLYSHKIKVQNHQITELEAQLQSAYQLIKGGTDIVEFARSLEPESAFPELLHLRNIIRGILITEEGKLDGWRVLDKISKQATLHGLPLTDVFGAGRLVKTPDHVTPEPGSKPMWLNAQQLVAALSVSANVKHASAGRKKSILQICDGDLDTLLDCSAFSESYSSISGLIVYGGGMTGHVAVFARGVGISAIGVHFSEFNRINNYNYCAVQNGKLFLFKEIPDGLETYILGD